MLELTIGHYLFYGIILSGVGLLLVLAIKEILLMAYNKLLELINRG